MEKTSFWTTTFDSQWIAASRRVPRSAQKVMIVLHGRGDSMAAFRNIRAELRLPHMNYLLLNAPRKFGGGFSWGALAPRTVDGIRPLRQKFFDLIEELKAYDWKPEEIFFLGHSQGCFVACDLVLNHPASFGGLIGVSGYVHLFRGWKSKLNRSGGRETPWLLTHGTRDRVIRPAEIRADIAKLTTPGGVAVLFREFHKGHDFDFENEVPFIRDWVRQPRSRRKASASLST